MLSKKLKPGDLVTFNCAGSKGKTLAMVIGIEEGRPMRSSFGEMIPGIPGWIQVQWIQVSKWMPRRFDSSGSQFIEPGDIVRHPANSAFEVAQ